MATGTQNFTNIWEPIYREVINLSMRSQEDEHSKTMRVQTSNRHFERYKSWAGLGLPTQKPELAPIQFDDPVDGGIVETQHSVKAKGFKASYEVQEDDKLDVIRDTASSLGDCLREGYEIDFAALWNRCLSTDASPITVTDGLAICHDSHTALRVGVATQDNLFTGDISLALIQSFRYHFRNLRTDSGFHDMGHVLAKLIIAPDATVEPLLDQILGGIGRDEQPFTADRTPHELRSAGGIQKVVYSYLTDTDRTIALSSRALTQKGAPTAFWRRRPSMRSWEDEAIQGSCYAASYRNSVMVGQWRGIAASGG